MATALSQDSQATVPSGATHRFGIVVSDFNSVITGHLLDGCLSTLRQHEVTEDHLTVFHVPGAFELPMGARMLLNRDRFDAVICLGCVIKGETKHDEYISQAIANGLQQLSLMSNVPMIFGVLTPDTLEQAEARAGGALGNKGCEAAEAALHMAALRTTADQRQTKIGFA
jgi:6,7-dimethyl-8-ribityllumazine synthase